VQIANELGKDIWINVPALVDDAYVRSLAELLQRTLAPDRAVYVEYSNELWNTQFPQAEAKPPGRDRGGGGRRHHVDEGPQVHAGAAQGGHG
jgi:hypothetical protein